jgi:Rho GDP-dissociation inhibitor
MLVEEHVTNVLLVAEEDAPSGMLARGHYNAVSTFVDDDKKTHLTFEWSFDIAKDW